MAKLLEIMVLLRDAFNDHVVFSLGILLILGYFAGKAAERLKLPAISGYIVAGLILGDSITGIIHAEMVETLRVVTDIALGIIAITIGGEFEIGKIRRLGKGILFITVFQLITTFLVVGIALYLFRVPLIEALLLGAVASATAPAATVVIIQSLKARGDFVDTLYGIVALDDAGCLILFAAVFAFTGGMIGIAGEGSSFAYAMGHAVLDISLSLLIGIAGGLVMHLLTSKNSRSKEVLVLSLGMIFVITAVAISLKLSPLLANMMAGAVLVNTSKLGPKVPRAIAPLTPPLYAAFFAIAGTELKLDILRNPTIILIGLVYIVSRAIGKYGGVWLGAVAAKTNRKVRKYMGLSMLPQAGVAIGLVLFLQATPLAGSASPQIKTAFAEMTNIVLFSVLINEIIGPPLSRFAIVRGAEL